MQLTKTLHEDTFSAVLNTVERVLVFQELQNHLHINPYYRITRLFVHLCKYCRGLDLFRI